MQSNYDKVKFQQCPRCREFSWNTAHKCERFEILIPDVEYCTVVWAIDEQHAAAKVVELYDEQDCHRWAGDCRYIDVEVRKVDEFEFVKFVVSCEVVPNYYADKAE